MKFSEIAEILNKDVKTVWTFSSRGLKKLKSKRRSSKYTRASPSVKKLEKKTKSELVNKLEEEISLKVPLSIFSGNLSPLEAIVKFLFEKENKSITEISKILEKEKSSISFAYQKCKSKRLIIKRSDYDIPILYFSNNSFLSISESITTYLHDKGVSFSKISQLLNIDSRTVWTFYSRSLSKQKLQREEIDAK